MESDNKKNILVVEDDQNLLQVLEIKLSQEYNITTAQDGEEAIDILKKDIPLLILLDIMLPKKSGLDVLDWIKSQPTLKDVPVIVMSNLSNESDIKASIERGAKEHLIKMETPLSKIIEKIKFYLGDS